MWSEIHDGSPSGDPVLGEGDSCGLFCAEVSGLGCCPRRLWMRGRDVAGIVRGDSAGPGR